MKITTVKLTMPSFDEEIKDQGFNRTGDVQQYATQRAEFRMRRHVPKGDTGLLGDNVKIGDDYVEYESEYSRYQYFGILYVDPETGSSYARKDVKKVPTGINLNYSGAPQRGAFWDEKMIADQGDQYFEDIQDYVDKRSD